MNLPDKIETTRDIDGWFKVDRTEREIMQDVVEAINNIIKYLESINGLDNKES